MNLGHLLNHPHATFHDAILEHVEIEYVERKAVLKFQICIGDPNSKE